jgi:spore maturation protein CgeB
MKVEEEYQSDVCFVGTMYPERIELLNSVNWDGIDTKFIGPNLEAPNGMISMGATNRLPNTEVAKYYAGAKICLNIDRTVTGECVNGTQHISEGEAWSLGPRAYEIAASGSFQIGQRRAEMEELFGGLVPTFRTADELESLVRHYLNNDEERQRLAKLQMERVKPCSFGERARKIVIPNLERIAWSQRQSMATMV